MASPTIVQTPDVEPNEPRKASIDKRTIEGTNATHSPSSDRRSPAGSAHSCVTVKTIDTAVPARPRSDSDQTPQSVIHAPQGFRQLETSTEQRKSPPLAERRTPSASPYPSRAAEPFANGEGLPIQQEKHDSLQKTSASSPVSPSPIPTSVDSFRIPIDRFTLHAQTRAETEESEDDMDDDRIRRSRSPNDIADAHAFEDKAYSGVEKAPRLPGLDSESSPLQTALSECWTLCNTLAGLSSRHRDRIFNVAGVSSHQDQAWQSCWKLCQTLIAAREDPEVDRQVRPILDLCHDFCQSLFDDRLRSIDMDPTFRISFDLNNHLYKAHDRALHDDYHERTLDFYIAFCHRLIKQRPYPTSEADILLRAGWSLAEMLFCLRQSRRERLPPDEESLGSTVQSCWDLCDLFREGWTQIRPERDLPQLSQTAYSQAFHQPRRGPQQSPSRARQMPPDLPSSHERKRVEPETPTTIFEDLAPSPDDDDEEGPAPPNILVLGTINPVSTAANSIPSPNPPPPPRWSSNASTLSTYSQSTDGTSSSATTTARPPRVHQSEPSRSPSSDTAETHTQNVRILILKAALNAEFVIPSSFDRTSSSLTIGRAAGPAGSRGGPTLNTFVKSLPPTAFGQESWQISLLTDYRKLVLADPVFRLDVVDLLRELHQESDVALDVTNGSPVERVEASAEDIAKGVKWKMDQGDYGWLRDLYVLVFERDFDFGDGDQLDEVTFAA